MPTVLHRRAAAWTLSSPSAGRKEQATRTLAQCDTRAAAEEIVREELELHYSEKIDAALARHTWTADGWRPDTFGAAIRTARKRAQLTIKDAAARMGLAAWQNWQQWESDEVEPVVTKIFRIADALGTTPDALRPFTAPADAADSSAARPAATRRAPRPARSAKRAPRRRTSGKAAP